MKRDVMEKWVADLRANPDKQAKDVLFDGQGYCCLGRLAVVLGFEAVPKQVEEYNDDGERITKTKYMFDEEYVVLSDKMQSMADIRTKDGAIWSLILPKMNDIEVNLTDLNDSGLTFDQIADTIEHFWEDL